MSETPTTKGAKMKAYTKQEHDRAMDRLAADLSAKGAHTPGPWRIRGRTNIQAGESVQVACAGFKMGDWPREAYAEEEANARLIAAAPDLAEVCRMLLMDLTTDAARRALCGAYGEKAWRDRIDLARAALTKAGL